MKHGTMVGFKGRRRGATPAASGQGRFDNMHPGTATGIGKRAGQDLARLAKLAGDRAPKTPPMDNARRAKNYRRQRGCLAPVLTDRQRRRLRKNLLRVPGVTRAGLPVEVRP